MKENVESGPKEVYKRAFKKTCIFKCFQHGKSSDWLIDWLTECVVFYATSAVFQHNNGGFGWLVSLHFLKLLLKNIICLFFKEFCTWCGGTLGCTEDRCSRKWRVMKKARPNRSGWRWTARAPAGVSFWVFSFWSQRSSPWSPSSSSYGPTVIWVRPWNWNTYRPWRFTLSPPLP